MSDANTGPTAQDIIAELNSQPPIVINEPAVGRQHKTPQNFKEPHCERVGIPLSLCVEVAVDMDSVNIETVEVFSNGSLLQEISAQDSNGKSVSIYAIGWIDETEQLLGAFSDAINQSDPLIVLVYPGQEITSDNLQFVQAVSIVSRSYTPGIQPQLQSPVSRYLDYKSAMRNSGAGSIN